MEKIFIGRFPTPLRTSIGLGLINQIPDNRPEYSWFHRYWESTRFYPITVCFGAEITAFRYVIKFSTRLVYASCVCIIFRITTIMYHWIIYSIGINDMLSISCAIKVSEFLSLYIKCACLQLIKFLWWKNNSHDYTYECYFIQHIYLLYWFSFKSS